jgi:phosphate-selective porin OprO/OprP
LLTSPGVHAQSGDPTANPETNPSAVVSDAPSPPAATRRMMATWEDGLVLQSDDGDYRIQVGTLLRFDGRFAPNDPAHFNTDTFLVRYARATIQGRIAKYIGFKINPDFGASSSGIPTLADAYIDVAFSDAFHVRAGRDKAPISYENLLFDANVLFLERGLAANLSPVRDTGAAAYGTLPGGVVSYVAGIFNGAVDGSSSTNADTESSKDYVGRLVVKPFVGTKGSPLEGLGLALGGSSGAQRDAGLPTYRTSVQQAYFSYGAGVISQGARTRVSPQVFYYYKYFGGYAEYARTRQGIAKELRVDATNTAWDISASFILTGELAGERVHPRRMFDPEKHEWGALALTARYGGLAVDPAVFALGFAAPGSSRQVNVATIGAIWFLNANTKALFNVERSVFDHNPKGPRYAEHAVLMRLQVNY